MSIFWKDNSKHPLAAKKEDCKKEWFPVFRKEHHRDYNGWPGYSGGVREWDSYKQIKTSLICVCLDGVKHYECKDENREEFVAETDLKFPSKDC